VVLIDHNYNPQNGEKAREPKSDHAAVIGGMEFGRVSKTPYFQIAWAVALGAPFFCEHRDFWATMGLGAFALAGVFAFMGGEIRFG
jgi:hypothetical protein